VSQSDTRARRDRKQPCFPGLTAELRAGDMASGDCSEDFLRLLLFAECHSAAFPEMVFPHFLGSLLFTPTALAQSFGAVLNPALNFL